MRRAFRGMGRWRLGFALGLLAAYEAVCMGSALGYAQEHASVHRESAKDSGGGSIQDGAVGSTQINLLEGLAHCWFLTGTTAPVDACPAAGWGASSGSGSGLRFQTGAVENVLQVPGVAGVKAQRLTARGYVGEPGQAYVPVGAYGYQAGQASIGTWGDGKAHTVVMLMRYDPFAFSSAGAVSAGTTPLEKSGEYGLAVSASGGGSVTLEVGAGLAQHVAAAPYAQQEIEALYPESNPIGPWYMVSLWYDGVSEACIALNDSATESCVTGVKITESPSLLQVGGHAEVEYVAEWDRVLTLLERQSLYASRVTTTTPFFVPIGSAVTTYRVAGSSCLRGNGWGLGYGADGYTIPNPYTTCTVRTNAPYLEIKEVVLENPAKTQSSETAQVQVSLDDGTWGENPYATLLPGSEGENALVVTLPKDGATHAVTFDASSYVGYSGSDQTPTAGMRAGVVETVSVPQGYSLQPVSAPPPRLAAGTAWLFYSDSIGIGAETNFPSTDGYIQQLRVSGRYAGEIEMEAYGGRALMHDMPTAGAAKGFADLLKGRWGCPARFTASVMTNDYGRGLETAAAGGANMAAFWAEWNSICPETVNVQQSALRRSVEIANALGDTLGSWRVQMAAACSAAKSCSNVDVTGPGYPGPGVNCVVPGAIRTAVFPSQASDGLHLTTCGATMLRGLVFAQW